MGSLPPPLAGMEVLSSGIESGVLYVGVRLDVNVAALTIDQVINQAEEARDGHGQ